MRVLSIFSGIGGFDIAAEAVGWEVVGQVEIDPFCQAVLTKHWPHVKRYGDIKTVKGDEFGQVDLVCGGPPCQPVSLAGRRKGTADNRWLWDDALRIVETAKPRWCLFENPPGILSIEDGVPYESVLSCLEDLGYEVWAFGIPACAVGAPHKRDRVWIVGHAQYDGFDGSKNGEGRGARGDGYAKGKNKDGEPSGSALSRSSLTNAKCKSEGDEEHERDEKGTSTRAARSDTDAPNTESGREWSSKQERAGTRESEATAGNGDWLEPWPEVAARLCRMDDGLPSGLSRPRGWRNAALKAYGNAIVPQVAIELMRAIKEADLQLR
jgi:DNA (cytosine-5)-methyltransferase 1